MYKKVIALLMPPIIWFTSSCAVLAAQPSEENMYDQIIEATTLFEEVFEDEYEEEKRNVENLVNENGWDYNLTIEAAGEKSSAFANVDYTALIAAYLTVSDNYLTVYDIDFMRYDYAEASIQKPVPYKYFKYEQDETGVYRESTVAYLTVEGDIDVYTDNGDGTYSPAGTKHIVPEEKEVLYGDGIIRVITPEEIMNEYGNGYENEKAEYESRYELLKASGVNVDGLRQSIMLQFADNYQLGPDEMAAVEYALENTSGNRLALIQTATSLIGKVPYLWGGKPQMEGYDPSWWSFDANGEQKGLDCSGYVSWVYRTSGYPNWNSIASTSAIRGTCTTISESELQIGDLGLLNNGESVNHTGIYLGNGYWIHCASSQGTVCVTKFPFTIFKRVADIDNYTLTGYTLPDMYSSTVATEVTDHDVYLLAQLISHEAKGQGLNGWIGVAEVVRNRMESNAYPNSLQEVIYQQGQFEKVEDIIYEQPNEYIIATAEGVLSGRLSILNDKDVLYFRNPYEKDMEDWGKLKACVRINDHVFYK